MITLLKLFLSWSKNSANHLIYYLIKIDVHFYVWASKLLTVHVCLSDMHETIELSLVINV